MIHLVTGKGGVGKSTVSAALALALSQKGQRTLLVELGERSFLRYLFHVQVGHEPILVQPNLSLALWDGEACLREYLLHLLKVERLVGLFFDNRIMRALVQAAPALKELALLGKITSGERLVGPPLPYTHIVVDAYSTGHFRALWRAPRGMAKAIPFGPMGEQSRGMEAVISNPQLTKFHVVATTDEMSVVEGLELASDIRAELKQESQLILNRCIEVPSLALASIANSTNDFAKYVGALSQRKGEAERKVNSAGFDLVELPWLLEASGLQKISELAKVLGAP